MDGPSGGPPRPPGSTVDVESAVARRKLVVRGAAPARWTTGIAALVLVTTVYPLLPQGSPVQTTLLPVAIAVAVLAARAVRPLRTGSRRAAGLTLAAVALLLVLGLLVVDSASVSLQGEDRDGPLAFAAGMAAGFGRGVPTVVYSPWTGSVNVPIVFPATLFLAGVANGCSWGARLRWHRNALVASWFVRWPLLLLVSVLLIAVLASTVDLLADAVVPAEVFAVLVLVPVLVITVRGAVEVLRWRGAADGLPPAWEPATIKRRRFLTGRRLPLVLLLLATAATAFLAFFLSSQLLRFSVEALVESSPSITPGAVTGIGFTVWSGSVLLLLAAFQLHTLARRSAALDAAALRGEDDRARVLLLRSFGDDDVEVPTHRSPRHSMLERMLSRRRERFEAMLTWHLWRFGPVIGVGRPRERLPRLGAAREYLSDEEWQRQVECRIREARAVVVVLGRTEGLGWELRAIKRLGAEGRTVLIVPPVGNEELVRRWRFCDEVMAEAGWPLVPPEDRPGMLTAVLRRSQRDGQTDTGDASWTVFAGRVAHEWQYEIAVEAALVRLEPLQPPTQSTAGPTVPAPRSAVVLAGPPRGRTGSGLGRLPGTAWLLGVAYALALVSVGSSGTGTSESFDQLGAGACVAPLDAELVEREPYLDNRMEVLSCNEPHPYEVVANVQVEEAGGPFPGEDALVRRADDVCVDAASDHVGAAVEQTTLELEYRLPNRLTWALGDDDLLCVVTDRTGLLARSVAGLGR